MPIPECAREIIRKADDKRQTAKSIDEAVERITKIEPVKPGYGNTILGLITGPRDLVVNLVPNWRSVAVDVRQLLIDAYTKAADDLRNEADALEARIQVLDLR